MSKLAIVTCILAKPEQRVSLRLNLMKRLSVVLYVS